MSCRVDGFLSGGEAGEQGLNVGASSHEAPRVPMEAPDTRPTRPGAPSAAAWLHRVPGFPELLAHSFLAAIRPLEHQIPAG